MPWYAWTIIIILLLVGRHFYWLAQHYRELDRNLPDDMKKRSMFPMWMWLSTFCFGMAIIIVIIEIIW